MSSHFVGIINIGSNLFVPHLRIQTHTHTMGEQRKGDVNRKLSCCIFHVALSRTGVEAVNAICSTLNPSLKRLRHSSRS